MSASNFRKIARETLKGKWKVVLPFFLPVGLFQQRFGLMQLPVYQELSTGNVIRSMAAGDLSLAGWWALELLIYIVNVWLLIGLYTVACKILDGKEPCIKDLFRRECLLNGLLLGLLGALVTNIPDLITAIPMENLQTAMLFLVLLLLIGIAVVTVVCIWLYLRWAMSYYLIATNPSMGFKAILVHSFRRMKGKVFACICLMASFLGWMLLQYGAAYLVNRAVAGLPGGTIVLLLFAMLVSAPLQAYITTAQAAFYRWVDTGEKN